MHPPRRVARSPRESAKLSVTLCGSLEALRDSFQGDVVQHPQRRSAAGCATPTTPTAAAAPAPGLGAKQHKPPNRPASDTTALVATRMNPIVMKQPPRRALL